MIVFSNIYIYIYIYYKCDELIYKIETLHAFKCIEDNANLVGLNCSAPSFGIKVEEVVWK